MCPDDEFRDAQATGREPTLRAQENTPAPPEPRVQRPPRRRAIVRDIEGRQVRFYPIQKSEMRAISLFNALSTGGGSIGVALAITALQEMTDNKPSKWFWAGAVVFLVAAAAAFYMGNSIVSDIKAECGEK